MKALVAARTDGAAPHGTLLTKWLESGNVDNIAELDDPDEHAAHDTLSQSNVVRQLDNLMTYPSVQKAIAERGLQLIGLYFNISTAEVRFFDETHNRFVAPDTSSRLTHNSTLARSVQTTIARNSR